MDIKSTTGKLLKGDISGVVSDVKDTIERSLGLVGLIIVTIAASIGSGLFVLPSFAAAIMGPGIWLAFLLAGLVFLPGSLSKSELLSYNSIIYLSLFTTGVNGMLPTNRP